MALRRGCLAHSPVGPSGEMLSCRKKNLPNRKANLSGIDIVFPRLGSIAEGRETDPGHCMIHVYLKVSAEHRPFHTEMTSFHVSLSLVDLVQPCWLWVQAGLSTSGPGLLQAAEAPFPSCHGTVFAESVVTGRARPESGRRRKAPAGRVAILICLTPVNGISTLEILFEKKKSISKVLNI
jgi:hypothetical protein